MADIDELIAGIDGLLGTLANMTDLGTWGTPTDYSLIVRQDQPAGSGSSQYKCEDLPMGTQTVIGRGASGDIAAVSLSEEQVLGRASGGNVGAVNFSTILATSHNHAASEITSGTLDNGRVSSGNVTQHEGDIDHDNLTNFVADEHVDHTGVTITAGTGLDGGGDISANRTINIDSTVTTLTGSQTLTNKTLTTPTIGDFTNATHDHADAAGGGNLAAKYRQHSHMFYLSEPATDDAYVMFSVPVASTIKQVKHRCYGSSTPTVDFNIEERGMSDPEAAGTNIWSTDKESDTTLATESSFNNDSLDADDVCVVTVSATSGTVTSLWVQVTVEYD